MTRSAASPRTPLSTGVLLVIACVGIALVAAQIQAERRERGAAVESVRVVEVAGKPFAEGVPRLAVAMEGGVHVLNGDGGWARLDVESSGRPMWSPNGRYLAIFAADHLTVLDTTTMKLQRLRRQGFYSFSSAQGFVTDQEVGIYETIYVESSQYSQLRILNLESSKVTSRDRTWLEAAASTAIDVGDEAIGLYMGVDSPIVHADRPEGLVGRRTENFGFGPSARRGMTSTELLAVSRSTDQAVLGFANNYTLGSEVSDFVDGIGVCDILEEAYLLSLSTGEVTRLDLPDFRRVPGARNTMAIWEASITPGGRVVLSGAPKNPETCSYLVEGPQISLAYGPDGEFLGSASSDIFLEVLENSDGSRIEVQVLKDAKARVSFRSASGEMLFDGSILPAVTLKALAVWPQPAAVEHSDINLSVVVRAADSWSPEVRDLLSGCTVEDIEGAAEQITSDAAATSKFQWLDIDRNGLDEVAVTSGTNVALWTLTPDCEYQRSLGLPDTTFDPLLRWGWCVGVQPEILVWMANGRATDNPRWLYRFELLGNTPALISVEPRSRVPLARNDCRASTP